MQSHSLYSLHISQLSQPSRIFPGYAKSIKSYFGGNVKARRRHHFTQDAAFSRGALKAKITGNILVVLWREFRIAGLSRVCNVGQMRRPDLRFIYFEIIGARTRFLGRCVTRLVRFVSVEIRGKSHNELLCKGGARGVLVATKRNNPTDTFNVNCVSTYSTYIKTVTNCIACKCLFTSVYLSVTLFAIDFALTNVYFICTVIFLENNTVFTS